MKNEIILIGASNMKSIKIRFYNKTINNIKKDIIVMTFIN